MAARIPRAWAGAFHPQAARGSSQLAYRPGYRGSGQQPMARVPVGAYTGKISGIQLSDGQAQGVIPGAVASGSVTSPAAFAIIAVVTFPVSGTYNISWSVSLGGSVSGVDGDNFALFLAGITLEATSVNPPVAGTYAQAGITVTATAGTQLFLTNPNAGTVGAIYGGTIAAAPLVGSALTLSVGPQALGTVWYPAQVTLSTTTGVLDTSTANIYLGSQGVPVTLVGTVFSGNGTAALAIPSMTPGDLLIVTWAGGHPGDTAAFNVIGTMDAITTGASR